MPLALSVESQTLGLKESYGLFQWHPVWSCLPYGGENMPLGAKSKFQQKKAQLYFGDKFKKHQLQDEDEHRWTQMKNWFHQGTEVMEVAQGDSSSGTSVVNLQDFWGLILVIHGACGALMGIFLETGENQNCWVLRMFIFKQKIYKIVFIY